MPTMKDVAEHAGVGVMTVSRVINNSGYTSEATREKVMAAVKSARLQPKAASQCNNKAGKL